MADKPNAVGNLHPLVRPRGRRLHIGGEWKSEMASNGRPHRDNTASDDQPPTPIGVDLVSCHPSRAVDKQRLSRRCPSDSPPATRHRSWKGARPPAPPLPCATPSCVHSAHRRHKAAVEHRGLFDVDIVAQPAATRHRKLRLQLPALPHAASSRSGRPTNGARTRLTRRSARGAPTRSMRWKAARPRHMVCYANNKSTSRVILLGGKSFDCLGYFAFRP